MKRRVQVDPSAMLREILPDMRKSHEAFLERYLERSLVILADANIPVTPQQIEDIKQSWKAILDRLYEDLAK